MLKARSKKLLVLAIVCTALTTGLVAVWIATLSLSIERFETDARNWVVGGIAARDGAIAIHWTPPNGVRGPTLDNGWTSTPRSGSVRWWASVRKAGAGKIVRIPLWMPTCLALAAGATAWHLELRSRRRARAGLCPTCRYDLAATPTGAPCPECGTPARTVIAASAAAGSRENAE